jgi:hypothetical protein
MDKSTEDIGRKPLFLVRNATPWLSYLLSAHSFIDLLTLSRITPRGIRARTEKLYWGGRGC